MKIFSTIYDFSYPWEEVSTANWRKYSPWNRESGHVIAVDTLSRRVDPDTGILRTERLITCRQAAPRWIKPLLGGAEVSHVYEVSYVKPPKPLATNPATTSSPTTSAYAASDPTDAAKDISMSKPSVTMTSQNLTWSDLLSVRETVKYTPSPTDPLRKTRFEQHANIVAVCGGWQKVRDKIEGFTADRFRQNAERGRIGFEEVLEMSAKVFGEEKQRERQMAIERTGADAKAL